MVAGQPCSNLASGQSAAKKNDPVQAAAAALSAAPAHQFALKPYEAHQVSKNVGTMTLEQQLSKTRGYYPMGCSRVPCTTRKKTTATVPKTIGSSRRSSRRRKSNSSTLILPSKD
mmetsp:Transcript_6358/g.11799  ORF Transcript_6358/g.11799 Transcript_6358/m.11799 type:complete len:115 (-) Transcript_6358:546-890(-)